jgi:hypothetical protein
VPSTNALPSLTLGFRRAEMTAFWVFASILCAAALGLMATAVGAAAPWGWAVAGLGIALPGAVRPIWFEWGIRAWNKGVHLIAAALRGYVLTVCYYLLFAPIGRSGSSLNLALSAAETSRWIARSRHNPTIAERRRSGGNGRPDQTNGGAISWSRGLLASMASSSGAGKAWTVCLMPVMLLLVVLRDEQQENQPSSSTYTLY